MCVRLGPKYLKKPKTRKTAKVDQNKRDLKRMLFNEKRQYNTQIFDKTIFLKYRTDQSYRNK